MPHTCKHDAETLKQLQALSIKAKVFEARQRIAEWVEHWGADKVYVAFSGGKDSTVLLDLVRRDYPDTPAVFVDTGLEFPEIREFVKTVDNVTWVKPKLSFKQTLERWGFPLISKRQARYIHEVRSAKGETATKRLRLTGYKSNGEYSPMGKISKKWQKLCNAPFKTSDKCCDIMKKRPMDAYVKNTGRLPFVGTMTDESQQRTYTYYLYGCNTFETKRPQSKPLSFWLEPDVWKYIKTRNLQYSTIYDMGYLRTGCMFCAFGAHLEPTPNRFQRMHETHPKQWKYCMDKLGMREALDYCGVSVEEKQLTLGL